MRGTRWRHTPRALAFVCALLVSSGVLRAEQPSLIAQLDSSGPQKMVVQLVLNQEKKGEYFVTAQQGTFLARSKDLQEIGLPFAGGRTMTAGSDTYVWLDSIPGVQVTFDEARLALNLVADPKLLPLKTVDLWAGRAPRVTYPDNASAFFNYDVGFGGGNGSVREGFFATTELGARYGDFLLLGNSNCASSVTQRATCIRLNTSLIHDNRETMVRTIAGDIGFATNALGSTLQIGGLSYSKVYDIDPYFIRYPQQNLVGTLPTASEVEVYIDGQRVRTLRLPAGQFDLRNVTQATGYRSVDLVIRDAFGREQRVTTSFYSSERSLKQGLHEYSYNVGALRNNYGIESDDYGPLAFAGFHRYGVNDWLTLGVRAEGKSGLVSGGPSATIVVGSMGTLTLAASASEYQGNAGGAALASYNYVGQHWNAAAFVRKDSFNYANLTSYTLRPPPGYDQSIDTGSVRRNWEAAANVGYTSPRFGSLSAGYYVLDAYRGQDRKAASLSYGRPIFDSNASFFVTVVNERASDRRTDVFAGFQYNFDAAHYLSGYYQRTRNSSNETLQFQQAQPVGEGLGYTIGVSHFDSPGASSTAFTPSFQYNARWGEVRGYTQQSNADGAPRSYALSLAGGIAWAGGMVAAGRPVTDSFGVVKVDEIEGVRVLVNNQEIGRTARDGRLFVPTLSSFNDNQISIDVGTVPMEVSFPDAVRVVSPAYRAGAVVDFHARALRAFVGRLRIRSDGQVRAAEFFDVALDVGGKPVSFVTGRGGEFYVEDLPEGRYRGRMSANGTRCTFELAVRAPQGPLTDLGDTTCERDEDPTERAGIR